MPSMSVQGPREYYEEALFLYRSIEAATGSRITRVDRNQTPLEWAMALTRARKKVILELQRRAPKLLGRQMDEFTYPDAEWIELGEVGRYLNNIPMAITLVEDKYTGEWIVLERIEDYDRWRHDHSASRGGAGGYNLEGTRFRLLPPLGERQCRITYVPMPRPYTVEDLQEVNAASSGSANQPDLIVPAALQQGVPIWAAFLMSVRDGAGRDDLTALWGSYLEEIETYTYTHDSAAPTFPITTRSFLGEDY